MAAEKSFSEKVPSFSEPTTFLSPQISSLLTDQNYVKEDGIAFKAYKRVNPIDVSELAQGGKSINFIFSEASAFVKPRRIFLDIDIECVDDNNDAGALKNSQYVTCGNPMGQSLVDSIAVNLGDTLLTRFDTHYSLLARVLFQTEYSRLARKTFMKEFEEYDSDSDVSVEL